MALSVFAMWAGGFFMVGHAGRGWGHLYGYYRMNLLSFFNSEGFSYVLPRLPSLPGDYEGFNFLGMGGLIVFLAAIPPLIGSARRKELNRRWVPLCAALSGLTLFAISNRIALGRYELLVLEKPHRLYMMAESLRSSGRMGWALFYAVVWASVALVAKGYRRRTAVTVLVVASVLQVVDTHAIWKLIEPKYAARSSTTWPSPLGSRFWTRAPAHYTKVRVIPPGLHPHWSTFAYYAAMHGMATDAVYLSRIDHFKMLAAAKKAETAIRFGTFAKDSLYILTESQAEEVSRHISEDDLLDRIDGFYVLAPGWRRIEEREMGN